MISPNEPPPLRDEDSNNYKIENDNVLKHLYIRDVPGDLHKRMKAICALYGRTMRDVAIDAIAAHVSDMEEKLAEVRQTPDRFNIR